MKRTTHHFVLLTLVALTMFAISPSLYADDSNYQTYVIGQRAMGMGGAATALADEAGGEYYNPAGLALSRGTSMSVSQTVYSVQIRSIDDAVGAPGDDDAPREDFSDVNIPIIPSALSVSFKFGKAVPEGKRYALGYSMFVPYLRNFAFSETLTYTPPEGDAAQTRLDVEDQDRTFMHGPTFAARILDRSSLGISVFHVYRSVDTSTFGYVVGPSDSEGFVQRSGVLNTNLDRQVHSLLFKIGTRHDIDRNWRAGFALTMPSITLTGSGELGYVTSGGDSTSTACPPQCISFSDIGGDTAADSKTPLAIRMGGAYTTDDGTFTTALDWSIHMPMTYSPYPDADLSQFVPSAENGYFPFGLGVPGSIERSLTMNLNVGAEYLLANWLFRGGFYTNFSSAAKVERSQFAQPSDIDMYGLSLSVGYRLRGAMVALGVIYAFGGGDASSVSAPPLGTDPSYVFGPRSERRDYFFLFIEGAGIAAEQSMNKMKGYFEEGEGPAEPAADDQS